MPVFRSRVKSKTPGKAPEIGALEPETPAKAREGLDEHLNVHSPLTPNQSVGLGSEAVQRRSARLASNLNSGLTEVIGDVKNSSRKRKKLGSGDNEISINGFNLDTPESENHGDNGNEDLHFRAMEVGVADGLDLETGVLDGARVAETRLVENEFAYSADIETLGQTDDRVESTGKGRRKRKSGTEMSLEIEHARHVESKKRFLNLRSGKRIVKVEPEVKGSAMYNEVENNIHVDLDSIGQNGSILEDCGTDGGFNLGTPESENHGDNGNEDLHFRAMEVGVADGLDLETGVLHGAGVAETRLVGNEFAYSADIGTLGQTDDRIESTGKGRRKRKSGTEMSLEIEHARHVESKKRFLNLRSGKRIVKVEPEVKGSAMYNEVENNIHVDLDSIGKNGSILEDCGTDGGTRNRSEADAKEAETGSFNSGMKFSRKEKGKMKMKFSRKEKGKMMVSEEDSITTTTGFKDSDEAIAAVLNELGVDINVPSRTTQELDSVIVLPSMHSEKKRGYQERFRDIAKRNASRFAHFSSQVEEQEDNYFANAPPGGEIHAPEVNGETEDWPGPFSTAMKIIRDRERNTRVQQRDSSSKSKTASVLWTPKKDPKINIQKDLVPSLQDLCLSILVKNADAISSLDCVPDVLRHKLSHCLCNARRMDSHFLHLLAHGSPTEIHLSDCSWLTEDDFTSAFEKCDLSNLTVLHLDQGGRCLADYILTTTLARSTKSLPALASLSLRGAYRLSDAGISVLVSAAPALRSINLSQCSLITSDCICCLAASLGSVLKELYLDDCQGIDAMAILPALLKMDNLEVLSLAGIETVSDDFIHEFSIVRGHNMKELVLANCTKLTDLSVRVIAEMCPELCAIDLSNLCKLTDAAIGYIANGCRAIQNLKLCRNTFSDEAVAAYLEICGEALKELSLSNVTMVADNTAISLARHSRNLNSLDLSWCRGLTEEALGLIVDSCLSLKVLKVFGCSQITNVFVSGHSNSEVEIIGLKMKPLLEHLNSPDFLQGPLRYSFFSPV